MNGMSGGWAWPANYKDGSSDDVFMTFIMGDNARDLSELSDVDMIQQIMMDLDAMFDGTPASDCFTNVTNDQANYVIQNWGKSPYTRGAYSFQTPTTGKLNNIILSTSIQVTVFTSISHMAYILFSFILQLTMEEKPR